MILAQGDPAGIVATEARVYSGEPDSNVTATTTVPLVATETRKVELENEDGSYSATGEIVSSQTISSKTRTVETITVSDTHLCIHLFANGQCPFTHINSIRNLK